MSDYSSNVNPFFDMNLKLSLKLEADGKEAELFTGHIERLSFNLHLYGFTGSLQFSTFDKDEVYQMMISSKIIKVTFAFKPTDPQKGTEPILELKGIVTEKQFRRLPANEAKLKEAHRVFEIQFSDYAKATWEQHHPKNIYVDESMKEIIEKHVNPDVKLDYKWDPLEVKHPVTSFDLEHQYWLMPHEQTNFYSFLIWYLNQEKGMLDYDYKAHSYTITGKKKEASGKPLDVGERFVIPPLCYFPQHPRFNERTIKHNAHMIDHVDKENKDSFKNIRRESIDPGNSRVYPEQAWQKVQSPLIPEKNEIDLEFTTLTDLIQLDKLIPGLFVTFKGDKGGNWSSDPCFKDKKFRIRTLYIEANKLEQSDETHKPILAFGMFVKAKLEEEEESFIEWPRFVPPHFPFYVQGKVFSDIGEKEQSTYKILESEKAPQGQYLIKVPLAGEKCVVAPFLPKNSGQDYRPHKKGSEVGLLMYFRTAKIVEQINWDNIVRLPAGVQGDQIVMATNGKDKYLILRHEFVDGKDSVFTLKLSSSKELIHMIEMKEKNILIVLEDEKEKKTRFIQVNHELGVVLSLEDKNEGVHQQVALNGKAINLTCEGKEGTSLIAITPGSITLDTKELLINCEKLTAKAADSINMIATNKCNIQAKMANTDAKAVKLGAG